MREEPGRQRPTPPGGGPPWERPGLPWPAILPVALVAGGAGVLAAWLASGGSGAGAAGRAPEHAGGGPPIHEPAERDESAGAKAAGGARAYEGGGGGVPDGMPILVTDALRRQPVAQALVTLMAPDLVLESRRELAWRLDGTAAASLLEDRWLTTTDRSGLARVPWVHGAVLATAQSGDESGQAWVLPGAALPVRIELHPRFELRVSAVGSDGRPVGGLPCALRVEGELRDRWRGVGDPATGEVYVPLPEPADRARARVRLALPLREPVEAWVGDSPEGVELRVPPLGRVVVRVPARESLAGEAVWVTLGRRDDDSGLGSLLGTRPAILDAAGRAVFPVGLGLDLVSELRAGGTRRPRTIEFAGPREEGQEMEVTAQVGGSYPRIRARALDSARRPLAGARLRADLEIVRRGRIEILGEPVRSDPEGRVVVPIRAPVEGDHEAYLSITAADPFDPGRRGLARVPIASLGGWTELEVGDLLLGPIPVLASGTVTDPEGRPLAGALVSAVATMERDGGRHEVGPVEECIADGRGRFELCGIARGPELCLQARRADAILGDPVLVPAGALGLRLVLTPGGTVEGRALLDAGLDPQGLELRLVADEGGAGAAIAAARANPDSAGRFRLGPAPAGSYRVAAMLADTPAPVAAVGPLDLAPGAVLRDARLVAWDLRGLVRGVALRVLDPQGRPVPDAWVRVLDGSAGTADRWVHLPSGQGSLLARAAEFPVLVAAAGFRPQRVHVGAAREEVRLACGLEVPFEAVLPEEPGSSGLQLEVRWVPQTVPESLSPALLRSPAAAAFAPRVRVGHGATAFVRLPWPGRYRLLWTVGASGAGPGQAALPSSAAGFVDVPDGAPLALLRVLIDAADLRAAIEALRP